MPYGVSADMQNSVSNLVDAYKRSELVKDAPLGIFALSAIIVDKAEPSEALKANIAWSLGLESPACLLSSLQLDNFRKGLPVTEETDVKGEKGAYFVHSEITLSPSAQKEWLIIANVNQNHASIIRLAEQIKHTPQFNNLIEKDIADGTQHLIELVASSDGLQLTADKLRDTRHFSNTLFNIMRGGIFENNYNIEKEDFVRHLFKANKDVFNKNAQLIEELPAVFDLSQLNALKDKTEDADFKRLCMEYLPLMFSRRHGDPSRPWNKFSINTHSEIDGSKVLDYQGNWRDIFQNWEALALSYPEFADGMIHKFLNATTFDGYNPYRITKDGFDWETIEPDNPWSYIGYWGDHQIIYLLKLLELIENHQPGKLKGYFDAPIFVYANVPYKIKSYTDILKNAKSSIEFDFKSDHKIHLKKEKLGSDGALLEDKNQQIYKVTFIEKILATVLAKMSNFIPEGGIWMNTQRPEWNDANNALVGNGVSMVTLYYLRRFMYFLNKILATAGNDNILLSVEMAEFFDRMLTSLEDHKQLLVHNINDADRKMILDGIAQAASDYRTTIYDQSFSGQKKPVLLSDLRNFVEVSMQYLDHSIRANKREDNLYHAYNIMNVKNDTEISIAHLSEMLEGQVGVLSSGYLPAEEVLQLLDSLKSSKLYREDQNSYILYPNKDLPRFLEKNTISEALISTSELLKELVKKGNTEIVEKDVHDQFHFNGNFKNANDLSAALDSICGYDELVKQDKTLILGIFEDTFNHKAFTGRSGTFYAYEGLGSIYWHMVSKLRLAVQECCQNAIRDKDNEEIISALSNHYYQISEGIGVHKSPSLYGAFPTDPYSHTPAGKGVKQPGMTGQVKEDILSRFGELGVEVEDGKLFFRPGLLKKAEMVSSPKTFSYHDVNSLEQEITLEKNSLCFTYCQIPVVYKTADTESVKINMADGKSVETSCLYLDKTTSEQFFQRTGAVISVEVYFPETLLK